MTDVLLRRAKLVVTQDPVAPSDVDGSKPSGSVPLGTFLTRTGAALCAGLPADLWVEASIIKVTANNGGGHTLELIDPGPKGAQAGQLRAFLPGTILPTIQRELGLHFSPIALTGLTAVIRLAPGFDPKWHLQARVLGLARSLQASLAARLLAEVRDRLRRDGLFDRQRLLPRPADVTRLAVVHPVGSAGLADIERELRRCQQAGILHVAFHPAPFDGSGAAGRLAATLRLATEPVAGHAPDLVLVVRGGGARSGLLTLDDEGLARTVATLGVPVVTGLGHATDRALIDEVAFAAADTPSKALGFVRDLLGEAARRASTDRDGIHLIAAARLDGAAFELATQQGRLLAGTERALAGAQDTLATSWGDLRAKIGEGLAQFDGVAAGLDRQLVRVREAVPDALERAVADGERLMRVVCEAVRRRITQTPDPNTLLAAVLHHAAALIAVAERDGDSLRDTVVASAMRHLDHNDGLLVRAETGLTDLDHTAVLCRGYTLVRDAAGVVLTSRATAMAAGHFLIEFGDGALAVVAVDPQPASLTGVHT